MTETYPTTETPEPGFLALTRAAGEMPPSSQAEMDAAVTVLGAYKTAWVKMPVWQKIIILERLLEDTHDVCNTWWNAATMAKDAHGNLIGEAEEWASLAFVLRMISLLADSLRDIERHGRPLIPGPLIARADGQVTARVYPIRKYDRLFLQNTTAEVWMEPGLTIDETLAGQARLYRDDTIPGRVCVVLGAGNTTMGVPSDLLYKLFVEGQVVIVKMNPVNDYMGPIYARAFRELISQGFLRIVYGGAREGDYLCRHPGVDTVHMTGSDKTYEAVVFGAGEEGARRKAQKRPILDKPISAELGSVSPVIIVPGAWSDSDIKAQAEKLALWLTANAGFYCVTPRVIVQWAGWNQRRAFNQALADALARVPPRKAYYPGAFERHQRFMEAHPRALLLGEAGEGCLPWTFIPNVDARDASNICFQNESFCGLVAETAVAAPDLFSFLEEAVEFANQTLWGNLSATLIVHPQCLKKQRIAEAVNRAVADLQAGMVLVNQFAGFALLIGAVPWGAYPGNEIDDIQSGTGVICNTLMFDQPQKSVVHGPFSLPLDPMSLNARTVHDTCRKLADMQYEPALANLASMMWSAIRS